MNLGNKIKELRRKNNITQEKLANYLNISYQAVSRWENNQAQPDIDYLIPIAEFFGITTDELLGLEHQSNYSKLLKKSRDLWNNRKHESVNINEAIILCELIYNECRNDKIRYEAIQLLCYMYKEIGELTKAKNIIDNLPDTPITKDLLSEIILEGDELKKTIDGNIEHFLLYLWLKLRKTAKKKDLLTYEDRILVEESCIKLYQLFYYDELGVFNEKIMINNLNIAEIYAEIGDENNAIHYIEEARKCFEKYCYACEHDVVTKSIFIHNENIGNSHNGQYKQEQAKKIFDEKINLEIFNFVRDKIS